MKGVNFEQIFQNLDEAIKNVKKVAGTALDEDTLKQLRRIQDQVKEVDSKRGAINESIRVTEGKLRQARNKLVEISSEIDQARTKRQIILADEGDAAGVSEKIRRLKDEIAGRERKLSALREELNALPAKVEGLKKEAIFILQTACGKAWNGKAGELAEIAVILFRLIWCVPSPQESAAITHFSSPGLLIIPKICFKGEQDTDLFSEQRFNEDFAREGREILDRRREEIKEKVAVQRGLS